MYVHTHTYKNIVISIKKQKVQPKIDASECRYTTKCQIQRNRGMPIDTSVPIKQLPGDTGDKSQMELNMLEVVQVLLQCPMHPNPVQQ